MSEELSLVKSASNNSRNRIDYRGLTYHLINLHSTPGVCVFGDVASSLTVDIVNYCVTLDDRGAIRYFFFLKYTLLFQFS